MGEANQAISLATCKTLGILAAGWFLASFLAGCPGTSMELDRLAEASPMPRRRVAFADLSNSAERAATRKKPVARTAAPSPSISLPSPSSAASKEYPPWTRCFDPRYKYHYWYNHATGVSTWTEPNEAWVDEHQPAAAEDGDFWASWFDGDADEAIRREAAARTAEAARSEKLRTEVRDRIVRSAAAPAAVATEPPVVAAPPLEDEAPPAVASSPAGVAPPAAPAAVATAPPAIVEPPAVAAPPPAKVATSNGDLTARDALLGILAALLAANLYFAIYGKRRAVETAPPPVEVILSNATELVIPVSAEAPAAARAGGVLTIVLAPLRAFLGGIARLLVPRFPIA